MTLIDSISALTEAILTLNNEIPALADTSMSASEFVSVGTAVLAVIISIGTYKHGINRERKTLTISALKDIRVKYPNTRNLTEQEKVQYLTEMEYFATGVNQKIYDIHITSKMSGSRLTGQYTSWGRAFIEERRVRSQNSAVYCEYEKMIKRLQKMRKIK